MGRSFVPILIGTMAKAGDLPHLPADVSQELSNVYHRPGPRIEKRGGWKADGSGGATTGAGFMKWRDRTNNVDRLVLDDGAGNIYVKDATTEAWVSITAGSGTPMIDFANYKGALYYTGANFLDSYDGTVFDISPLREHLNSRSILAWHDRIWMFNIRQFAQNLLGTTDAYGDPAGGFTFTNVTAKAVVSNGVTTITWVPTNTTTAVVEHSANIMSPSSEDQYLLLRSDLLGLSPLFRMPFTLELFVKSTVGRSTAYLSGHITRPDPGLINGFRYKALAGGTTGAGAPAWNAVIGSDTVDGTVTWHNEGVDAFASAEIEIDDSADNQGRWQTEGVVAKIPPIPANLLIGARWKFGNSARPTYQLQPIAVGLKDGKADGHPQKANFGQQVTTGQFPYEFFNQQSSADAMILFRNRIICSEAGLPRQWRGDVFWEMVDGSGDGIVIRPVRDVLCAHKRDAISTYQIVEGTASAASPVKYVETFQGVGCVGTRAIDNLDGIQYFIGDKGVYAFDAQGPPQDITDDLMREAIFDSAGLAATAILKADVKNKELRLYTQNGKLWVYSLRTKKWTSQNVTKDAGGGVSNIVDAAYFRDKFYAIASTNGLVREETTATTDDVNGGGSFDVTAEVWLHPFESIPMQDALIESIEIHHKITGDQTGCTLEAAVSFDRGVTFPKQHTITIPIPTDNEPIRIPLWQSGANLTVRLRHKGKAGASFFNLFWAGAWVQTLGEETADSIPVTTSQNL